MQEDVTKLSPEAVKACQTCTNTCMALQYMCIWLGTQRCVSTCPKEAKPLDLPARVCKTVLRQNDGLESCPGMQTAHIHVEDVANKSNTSANTSVT